MTQQSHNPLAYFTSATGGHPEPLTPEQLSQITHARHRYKKVHRAINVAKFDAWTTAIFAGLSLLFSAIGFSIPGILLGLGMAAVSYNSFRGMRRLEELDASGTELLGKNQWFLGGLLFIYAAWNLYLIHAGKMDTDLSPDTKQQLAELGGQWINDLMQECYYLVYGALAVFAIVAQGLTSLYYFSRAKFIAEYLDHTAEWILKMQKMGFRL